MIVKSCKYVLCILLFAVAFGQTNCYSQDVDSLKTQYYYYLNFDKDKNGLVKADAKTIILTDVKRVVTTADEKKYTCSIEKILEESSKNSKISRMKFQCERNQTATIATKDGKLKVIYKGNISGGKEVVEVVHAFTSYKPDSLPDLMKW
jgi:hypothetical protein